MPKAFAYISFAAGIDVPKIMMPAISMIIMQFRNRRTGTRRTFQIAEILPDSSANILMQYDAKKDTLVKMNPSKSLMTTLKLFTGFTDSEIDKDLNEKQAVLKYLVKQEIETVDGVGRVMAEYYTNKENLMKIIKQNEDYLVYLNGLRS